MNKKLFLLFLFPLCLFALDDRFFEERTWQDREGRSITATFVSANQADQTVTFTMANGKTYTLPISKLSAAEQTSLQEYWISQESQKTEPASPSASSNTNANKAKTPEAEKVIPKKFTLKGVPMVKQQGNFCVPASATMISLYHGFKTDQEEVAHLSSAASADNEGTYPSDMILAMEKLGFSCQSIDWDYQDEKDLDSFVSQQLPLIKKSLVEAGPMYISFKPGVFGETGHGCVIIGYDDGKEEMFFHNPWGKKFSKDYEEVTVEGYGAVSIIAPVRVDPATPAFTQKVLTSLNTFSTDIQKIEKQLLDGGIPVTVKMCSRQDERSNKRFADQTARNEGRKILDLALYRHPAIIIPSSKSQTIEAYYYITVPEGGGAKFSIRTFSEKGWSEPQLVNLGDLTKNWTTLIAQENTFQKDQWDLPLLELIP